MTDTPIIAAEWRRTELGKVCDCRQSPHRPCDFFDPTSDNPSMCEHNMDKTAPKGDPFEITDFCFHREVRSLAKMRQIPNESTANL